jgi:hypothetical protein
MHRRRHRPSQRACRPQPRRTRQWRQQLRPRTPPWLHCKRRWPHSRRPWPPARRASPTSKRCVSVPGLAGPLLQQTADCGRWRGSGGTMRPRRRRVCGKRAGRPLLPCRPRWTVCRRHRRPQPSETTPRPFSHSMLLRVRPPSLPLSLSLVLRARGPLTWCVCVRWLYIVVLV